MNIIYKKKKHLMLISNKNHLKKSQKENKKFKKLSSPYGKIYFQYITNNLKI